MDKAVDLLKLLRGNNGKDGVSGENNGLRIIRTVTTDPNPVTFVFEGTSLALDIDVFEIPINLYPICAGDRFLTSPIVGHNTQRWGVISKINKGFVTGTMQSGTTCKVDGIGRTYTSADLLIPSYVPEDIYGNRSLKNGDTVVLLPTLVGSKVKYAILEHY